MFLRATLPDLTVCPQCGNADRSTFCQFCNVSKNDHFAKPTVLPMVIDPAFESELGCVKVSFRGCLDFHLLRVTAVIAPPDPEVGILYPYPVECDAVDAGGKHFQLSYQEARFLTSQVFHQLF